MNYLLLPGNPPAAYFYEAWKEEILRAQPGARVAVSPYPTPAAHPDSHAAMGEVAAVHAERLKAFHREVSGPVMVVGHSLGGYFALRLLREHSALIERAYLLHPFLKAPTKRGWLLLNFVRSLHPFERLKRGFVFSRKWVELFSNDLTRLTDDEIHRTFHLAVHEFRIIGQDHTPLVIEPEIRGKVRVIYTPGDWWCTPRVVAALREQVVTHECAEPHDFVTKAHQRAKIFERILELR